MRSSGLTSTCVLLLLIVATMMVMGASAYRKRDTADDGAPTATTEADAEFAYLDELTDDDLRLMLRERNVAVDDVASRKELRRTVIASEKRLAAAAASGDNAGAASRGHTLKALLCVGWGYRNTFEQYANVLRHHFPDLRTEAENYPPPPLKALAGQLLSYCFLAGMAILLGGKKLLPPAAEAWINDNKMTCVGIIFFINMMSSQMLQTGAFEIYLDDRLIFSKLQSGGMISVEQLAVLIRKGL